MNNSNNIKWNFSSYTDAKGRTYIISYYNHWDPEKKQSRIAKRIHVGRLNGDTGEVTLSKNYLQLHPKLCGKELFYENNKLIERDDEEIKKIRDEAVSDLSYRTDSVSFGLTYALWEKSKARGILDALKHVFGDEDGANLLRLGIYTLISRNGAMANYEDWLPMYYLPDAHPLSSWDITSLLSKVTQEKIDSYFSLRHDRILAEHKAKLKDDKQLAPLLMAIDSTSISTYSDTIDNASFGHSKQDKFLKQINLTLCADYDTGDICYAYESEGSITDMALYPELLLRMQQLGIDLSDVLLVTDRGYSSIMNVQKLINCKMMFLTGVPLKEDSVKVLIRKYRQSLNNPTFMHGALGSYARTAPTEKWTSTCDGINIEYPVYLHLYHDGVLGESQTRDFMQNISRLLEIKNNNLKSDPDLWRQYGRYVIQDQKSKLWSVNAKAVEQRCEFNGYFAIRTNTIKNPFDSLVIYRERNIVETAFRQYKVLNDCNRLNCSATSYKGKILLHLIAQSLRMIMCVSAGHHKAEGKILPGDSLFKAMLQLQHLQASRPAGRGVWIVKEIPKKTKDLFDLMDIPYPKKIVKN